MAGRTAQIRNEWHSAEPADDSRDTELITGEAVALDVRPASFILRAAGTIIDWIAYLLLFLAMVLGIVLTPIRFADQALISALLIASLVISIVVVPMAVETLTRGRSLGKLAVGVRVVRDDGGGIQLRHAFIRALTGVVEIYMTFGGFAALVALLSPRSKRLGDLLAGTYAQHERVPRFVESTFGVPTELQGWALTADVAKLPDRLSRRIAQFLAQVNAMTPIARAGMAQELARESASFVSPLPAAHPETFLVAVAVLRREREAASLSLERTRMSRVSARLGGLPHNFPER